MSFNAANPVAGSDANDLMGAIRTNNSGLETSLHFGHDFHSGGTQTGEHAIGSCKFFAGATAPTTKENGTTALDATDYGRRLWLDTTASPGTLKVLTAAGTWTSIAQLMGMLDEDDMASNSATLTSSQQSIKAYIDAQVAAAIVTAAAAAPSYGTWASKTVDTEYTATTQGVVHAYGQGGSYLEGFTPTATQRTASIGSGNYYPGLTMLVRKGDTWKVTINSGIATVWWLPTGA
jgi:hypothetical protein